jgi:hypothetical protein
MLQHSFSVISFELAVQFPIYREHRSFEVLAGDSRPAGQLYAPVGLAIVQ